MDPNATLAEARALAAAITAGSLTTQDNAVENAERMAELFDALDQWLSKGGFLPRAWERKP